MGGRNNDNEDLLVDGLRKGDFHDFEKIYNKYIRELYYLSMGYLNSEFDAQDAVQETFIYLWNKRESLHPNSNLRAYLRTIIKNTSLNIIRNKKIKEKHRDPLLEYEKNTKEIILNKEEHEEHSKSFDSKISLVNTRLEQLPKGCKKVFILSVIEGYSYKEVSEKMGISVNTVKTQVKIGYQKIRG